MKTILVVEDEENIRLICEMALQESGYRTLSAENGYQALKIIQEETVDCILSDIFMPKMNGFQLIRSIRADEFYRHIPVIFLTAATDDGHITEGLQLGVDDYITKPIRIKELLARVQLTLARAEARLKNHQPVPSQRKIEPHPDASDAVRSSKGNLKDRALMDIIAFCENNSLSGELIIEGDGLHGCLKYRKGELVEVTANQYRDDEALDRLLALKEGTFQIVQQLITLTPSAEKPASQTLPTEEEIKAEVAKASPVAAETVSVPEVDPQLIIRIFLSASQTVSRLLGEAKTANLLRRAQLTLVNSYPTIGFFLINQKGHLTMIKPLRLTAQDIKGCSEWLKDFLRTAIEKDKMLIGTTIQTVVRNALKQNEITLMQKAGFM